MPLCIVYLACVYLLHCNYCKEQDFFFLVKKLKIQPWHYVIHTLCNMNIFILTCGFADTQIFMRCPPIIPCTLACYFICILISFLRVLLFMMVVAGNERRARLAKTCQRLWTCSPGICIKISTI